VIEAARIPLSTGVAALWGRGLEARVRAATSDDDYEIAFTAPPGARTKVREVAAIAGVTVTEIGRVEAGEGAVLLDHGKVVTIGRAGYMHF
jgi:thiamine-monophosphate kinase